jgi:hypothetical protein
MVKNMAMSDFESWVKNEILLRGEFSTQDAINFFNVSRITIMRWIDTYNIKEEYNLKYNKKSNSYVLLEESLEMNAKDVLLETRAQNMLHRHDQTYYSWLNDASIDLIHPVNNFLFPLLITAIEKQKVLNLEYQTKEQITKRDVSVHQVIFINDRYHVRVYCHTTRSYIDLNLNRILDLSLNENEKYVDRSCDKAWHEKVSVQFKINPALNEFEQDMVAQTYHLSSNVYEVKTTKALLYYIKENLLSKNSKGKAYFIVD